MPADALPIPWEAKPATTLRDRTTSGTITASSRTTTVSPRE